MFGEFTFSQGEINALAMPESCRLGGVLGPRTVATLGTTVATVPKLGAVGVVVSVDVLDTPGFGASMESAPNSEVLAFVFRVIDHHRSS